MPTFSYIAHTKTGVSQSGTISAHSQAAAIASLKEKNLQPVVVKPQTKNTGLSMNITLPGGNKPKPKDLVIFTRQFSTMVSAGVPMLRSLTTLRDQTESVPLKSVLEKVIADVQGGAQLSDALAKHPETFSEIYVNMVRAGESGGILDKILDRLANQVEKDSDIKGKLKGALIYPAVVCIAAVGAIVFIMVSVVPKLASIIQQSGASLPLQTKIVIGISNFLSHNWLAILIVLAVLAVAFRKYISTPGGRYRFHQLQLKLPIFGPIVMKVNVARFSRIFSSLMGAGVSVTDSLTVTAGALSNVVVRQALMDSVRLIKNGGSIAEGLSQSKILPQIIVQMSAVGEETGELDTVLDKVAEFYEKEVDTVIASMTSIIEPVLIVGLGGVVGVIVASVFGPISSIQGAVGG